jgi:hypothetical protein
MTDATHVLRNMSTPPTSVAAYRGLVSLTRREGASGGAVTGRIIAFRAPAWNEVPTPAELVRMLNQTPDHDPSAVLASLIDCRAADLPLPDATLIVEHQSAHLCVWPDLLSFLAVATKSTAHVWMRSKRPVVSRLTKCRSISMVVPPPFDERIHGAWR